MPSSTSARRKECVKMLRTYGFYNFRVLGNQHIAADHPDLLSPIQFSSSPSGGGYVRDLELRARRLLGLSGRGREAREGERRKKPKRRHVPQQRYGQGEPAQLRTLAEIRAEHTYTSINRMMREHP